MHKSKGRLRRFLHRLKGGDQDPDQNIARHADVAAPSPSDAENNSSVNKHTLDDTKDDARDGAALKVVRNSAPTAECESPPPSYETVALDEHDISREIWIEAYASLQNSEGTKDLVRVYETILSQELEASGEQSVTQTTNIFSRFGSNVDQKIPQMRKITENVLNDATRHAGIVDGFTKAADLLSELNGIVSPMIQSNPVAALAWGGICAALPLLLRPVTAESDMAGGLCYMIGRMQWYMCLVRGLLDATDQEGKNDQLRSQFKHKILDLYTNILTYQMQSVCYCYHDRTIVKALRAVVALDDWKGRLESIQQLEATVQKDMGSFAAVETLSYLGEIARSTKKLDIISSSLGKFVASQEQSRKEQEKRNQEAERTIRSELVGQFRTMDYERQMKLNPVRVPGTCEWFCSHEKFKNWLSRKESGLFLASADPGCGKSTLARYLVEEVLPESADATVLHFFFKDTPEQRLLTNALCAILHQLFYQKPRVAKRLKHQILQSMPRILSDVSALWALFAAACQDEDLGEVICVLDALDECEQDGIHILAESLGQLLQNKGLNAGKIKTSIKFLITTRGYPEILEQFSDVDSDMVYLSGDDKDEKDQIQSEISLVLDYQLEKLSQKKHFKTERKERIHEALKAKGSEQRTYLWLKLVFQLLESAFKTTTRDWEKLIAKPPSTVNKAYETLLARVDEDEKEAVRVLLHLIIAARRPLKLCEMNIALNVRDQSDAPDEESLGLSTDEEFKQWLLHTCGFFVTVYDERVYFIHQTAKEFLLRPDVEEDGSSADWCHSITSRSANRLLAESCIAYLSLKQFRDRAFQDRASQAQSATLEYESFPEQVLPYADPDPAPINSAYDSIFADYKLAHYALGFWARHFRECQYLNEAAVTDVSDTVVDKYLALFSTDSPGPPPWLLITLYRDTNLEWHEEGRQSFRGEMIQGYSLAKAAAYYNHIRLLQYAVQQSALEPTETGIEAVPSENGTTLLHLAMFKDCSVDFLAVLASYVNVDAREDISGQTALSMACSMGHWRAMDVLLDHGADPKITDCYGYSPLSHVARKYFLASPLEQKEYLTIMDRLFSHGADANSTSVPTDLHSTSISEKCSLLTLAAMRTGDQTDLRIGLEAVVASRSGETNPHVSSLAQAVLCPGLDLFSGPAFLDAFDKSFVKFVLDHGAIIDLPNPTGEDENIPGGFENMTALQGAFTDSLGHGDDPAFWGIAFLLHAGASSRGLGVRQVNEGADTSSTELSNLVREASSFGNRPATWALLMKLLGYDPLLPEVRDILSAEGNATLLHDSVRWSCSSADWPWLLLKHGMEIESRDENGHTPLHIACICESRKTVSFLLQQGADANARNDNAETPLHLARDAVIVQALCDNGADVNARDDQELTPLHRAYKTDSPEAAAVLFKHNANTMARDAEGRTPLHLACVKKFCDASYTENVRLLIAQHQTEIDARDTRDRTPLHEACDHGSPKLVALLLASKADSESRDAEGRTPLHVACENLSDENGTERAQIAELLLSCLADIEARDLEGRTPLLKSAQGKETELVKVLLTHKADVEARDPMGNTALHLACQSYGCHENIGLLVEYRADVEARNSSENTPIHLACQKYLDGNLEALLEHQPALEARDSSGRTPLHLACQYGEARSVEILLEHQANIEARDSLGRTPLHQACLYSDSRLVEVLLERQANIDAKDLASKTPLNLVCDKLESTDGFYRGVLREITKLLSQSGAYVNSG